MINALYVLSNVFAAMRDGEDFTTILQDVSAASGNLKNRSIYDRAKKSIAFFPVIFSSSISSEPVNPLLKALERQFAVFIKIAIQQEDVIDLSETRSKREFLRTLGFNVDNTLLSIMEQVNFSRFGEDIKKYWKDINAAAIEQQKYLKDVRPLSEIYSDHKYIDAEISLEATMTDAEREALKFALHGANAATRNARSTAQRQQVRDARRDLGRASRDLLAASGDARRERERFQDAASVAMDMGSDASPAYRNRIQVVNKREDEAFKARLNGVENDLKFERQREIEDMRLNSREQKSVNKVTATITDNDIKKFSELPPTVLEVAIFYRTGNTLSEANLTLGIKAVAHIFDSEEVVHNIAKGLKESNTLLRFLQWRSGEIKFWRDFLFNVTSIKDDVVTSFKKNHGSIWFRLKYLKNKDIISRFYSKGFTPTAVLALSVSDVTEIKKRSGIDLWEQKNVNKLFNTFYIVSFLIIDEGSKIVHINNGDELSYMKVDYKYLSNEQDGDSMKSLIGLLTRG
jgi:hypothetical protein